MSHAPQLQNPLLLISSDAEWLGRSLESVLEMNGYTVVRAQGGRRTLELARRLRPDALILDETLTEMSGVDVCKALRDDPLFDHSSPVIITSAARHADHVRTRAYDAGAWEYCTQPIDVDTLVLKLRNFVRGKRDLEEARQKMFVDPMTGLFSMTGLERWGETLGALARRQHEALACVAVQPASGAPHQSPHSVVITRMADLCRTSSRRSDVVGYLGDSRFAILAPDTNRSGVEGLVERLRTAIRDEGSTSGPWDVSVGYAAVEDFASAKLSAQELIQRAETALAQAYMLNSTMSFDDLPVN